MMSVEGVPPAPGAPPRGATAEAHAAPVSPGRPAALRLRVRRRVEAHLGSPDVAHVIYGAIIGLALVEALEKHPPRSGAVAATLVGSAIAVGLAELYSELVAADARTRRPTDRRRIRHVAREASAVVFGAGFPAAFFVLASAGVIATATAFALAKWTGLGLIITYGFLGARLSGSSVAVALAKAAAVGAIGGIVILLKALLH
jgi:hypothetical protein